MGELVCVKYTSNICFPSLFNYKVLIIMCHAFFDTLRISWYIKDFEKFNWKLSCMSKHNKGGFFFQNTWTKGYEVSMFMVIGR
jgi:hypothetical protein